TPISEAMTKNPTSMKADNLAIDGLNLMENKKITMLPIIDENSCSIGLLHMHDLIDAGII
ncbi:MAG: D-arabinose 5-phosphate isomerase, partial [Candidatus Cloacimonadota bacterium]|nr:D-arabinose 5-phosphate isomerase [Candidatus Cloacimonadota bacterium]